MKKLFNSKRADGVIAILIIIIILIFLGWLVHIGGRECRSNRDCGQDAYCGYDFACHQVPIVEKSPVVYERHYTGPALILGVAIVVAALILRKGGFKLRRPMQRQPSNFNNVAPPEPASRLKSP